MNSRDGVVSWLVGLASRLVPESDRPRFVEEWRAELDHVSELGSRLGVLRVAAGLIPDALTWRSFAHEARTRTSLMSSLERLRQDSRIAVRSLRRSPAFTVFALLSLGLGIGANAAMFGVVEDALLRPLPYAESDRLVKVWEARPEQGRDRNVVSYPDFLDWRAENTVFTGLAAYRHRGGVNLEAGASVRRVRAAQVSGDFFSLMGLDPAVGRVLTESDDVPGAERVVVLGYGLWESVFGGDPSVVGRTIPLNGEPYTVVGALGPGAAFPPNVELWQALALDPAAEFRGAHSLDVIGRMADGVTVERAGADVRRIAARLEAEYPQVNRGHTAAVYALRDEMVGERRAVLLVLTGGLVLLLLIVCANLASLQVARASSRRRELVLRSVLGATRVRLASQLVVESTILGAAGGALAVVLTVPILRMLGLRVTDSMPWLGPPRVDAEVLAFIVLAAVIAVTVTGLVPALRVSRTAAARVLAEDHRGTAGRRTRSARATLVVAELALALVLLVGAGLTTRTLRLLTAVDPGFDTQRVLTAELWLSDIAYQSEDARRAVLDRVLAGLSTTPGVERVGATFMAPLSGMDGGRNFRIEGRPEPDGPDQYNARFRIASGGYFGAAGIPLRAGRVFDSRDTPDGSLAMIINDAMRDEYWPDADPVGARVYIGTTPFDVIGVVGNVLHEGPRSPERPEFYLSLTQVPVDVVTLIMRSPGDPSLIAPAVLTTIEQNAPGAPVTRVEPMAVRVRAAVDDSRTLAALVGAFAIVATLLATLGVYGVMSYSVSQRTREIGVRMAVGGRAGTVRAMVLRDGLRIVAVALLFGLGGAFALSRTLTHLLFGVAPTDPTTFAAAAALLMLVAVLASLGPAVRATRVDPMVALRNDT